MQRFSKLKFAGSGTFGSVQVGRDKRHRNRFVALKKSLNDDDASEGVPWDVLREIVCLGRCRHSCVVHLLEVIVDGCPSPVLVLEGMQRSLSEEIKRRARMQKEEATHYLLQLCSGVRHMHLLGFMHRDVKPGNCLVNNRRALKVADMGQAICLLPGRANTLLVSTVWYRAPEVLLGEQRYSFSIDFWGIGCSYAQMRTGKCPFVSDGTAWHQLVRVMQVQGTPTEESWPGVRSLPDYNAAFPCFKGEGIAKDELDDDERVWLDNLLAYDPAKRSMPRHLDIGQQAACTPYRPAADFMVNQAYISIKFRGAIVEWMMWVSDKFQLLSMTRHVAVFALDSFLATRTVRKERLQLTAIAAMVWAGKLVEVCAPRLADYVYMSCNNCTEDDVLSVERELTLLAYSKGVSPSGTVLYCLQRDSLTPACAYACDLLLASDRSYAHSVTELCDACRSFRKVEPYDDASRFLADLHSGVVSNSWLHKRAKNLE